MIGFVSNEYYAALADVQVEARAADGTRIVLRSSASGAVLGDLPPGRYDVCLACPDLF